MLGREWILAELIGGGGFGQVYAASSPDYGSPAVAKLVPKAPGAQRELLFVDLGDARNVVPIIDSGETDDSCVLVMPRAEKSLRQHFDEAAGPLAVSDAVTILSDVATALADLDGRVVHRDLKPENVLLLDGSWCLADFGISRYAEATTAPDTQKHALSLPYAAPERWRGERATAATDVYSLGVIAYMRRKHRSEADRRAALFEAADAGFKRIAGTLERMVSEAAPAATVEPRRDGGWCIRLNAAELELAPPRMTSESPWGSWQPPAFEVIAHAGVGIRIPPGRDQYAGRCHSLWFCDARDADNFQWFETAFMISPLSSKRGVQNPFALDPGREAAKALWMGVAEFEVAWPFTLLNIGDLQDFVDRWASWFADAAQGRLQHPGRMPERPAEGSWRRA